MTVSFIRLLCFSSALLVFLYACSGSKNIVHAPNEKTVDATETKPKHREDIKRTDSVESPEVQIQKDTVKPDEFKQELSKRYLAPHQLWNELLQEYVSNEGTVNYKGLKKAQKDFYGYIYVLSLIAQHENFNALTREQKLAYWINAYNAFTVDLILRHYPVKSIKDIKDPWKQRHWKLGNKWYNLDEIEHKILRKMNEPRIHFAINCASFSCPKLQNKAFTAENLETQLNKATYEFLEDTNRNIISKDKIHISKLFQWFAKDFKTEGTLIDFLNKYSKVSISANAKKSFMDYNWNLNDK